MKLQLKPILIACLISLSSLVPAVADAQMPAIPQIPAFLPTVDQVSASQSMPLDGVWLISSIRKKVRIQQGRVFAVDGWLHLFVLQVQPGMVVMKDLVPTGPGKYSGEDLPLMGPFTAEVQADRSLAVSVQTTLTGTIKYKLIPIQIDNPQWYAQEMQAAGLAVPKNIPVSPPAYQFTQPGGGQAPTPAPPAYTPPAPQPTPPSSPASSPAEAECEEQEYDPETDTIRCYRGGGE